MYAIHKWAKATIMHHENKKRRKDGLDLLPVYYIDDKKAVEFKES